MDWQSVRLGGPHEFGLYHLKPQMLDELLVGHAPGVFTFSDSLDDDMDETCGHESGGSTRGASECSGGGRGARWRKP
jgi:hypothetical protein